MTVLAAGALVVAALRCGTQHSRGVASTTRRGSAAALARDGADAAASAVRLGGAAARDKRDGGVSSSMVTWAASDCGHTSMKLMCSVVLDVDTSQIGEGETLQLSVRYYPTHDNRSLPVYSPLVFATRSAATPDGRDGGDDGGDDGRSSASVTTHLYRLRPATDYTAEVRSGLGTGSDVDRRSTWWWR